jgi:hypothetical protein
MPYNRIDAVTRLERSDRSAWDLFHGERNAPTWNVDFQHQVVILSCLGRICAQVEKPEFSEMLRGTCPALGQRQSLIR